MTRIMRGLLQRTVPAVKRRAHTATTAVPHIDRPVHVALFETIEERAGVGYGHPLTDDEYARWVPSRTVLRYVERVRESLRLDRRDFTVLDWGCGRGQLVLHLRELGYSAFGAEPSTEAIERGRPLLQRRGVDVDHVIRPVRDGTVAFPPGSFDLVITYYVLEHVVDLDRCAEEIRRLTRPGGFGFHVYPGNWRPVEGHLAMPFVHWLPKGGSRAALIRAWLALGVGPKGWADTATLRERARILFEYSAGETFYRKYAAIRDAFTAVGFSVTPQSLHLQHPRVHAIARRSGQHWLQDAIERMLMELRTGELLMQMRGDRSWDRA